MLFPVAWCAPSQTAELLCDSILSAITAARCADVAGLYIPNLDKLPAFTPAFVLSADDNGNLVNTAVFNIRKPCSLHLGRPNESHATAMASPILSHHLSVFGVAYSPELPNATVSKFSINQSRYSKDSWCGNCFS